MAFRVAPSVIEPAAALSVLTQRVLEGVRVYPRSATSLVAQLGRQGPAHVPKRTSGCHW